MEKLKQLINSKKLQSIYILIIPLMILGNFSLLNIDGGIILFIMEIPIFIFYGIAVFMYIKRKIGFKFVFLISLPIVAIFTFIVFAYLGDLIPYEYKVKREIKNLVSDLDKSCIERGYFQFPDNGAYIGSHIVYAYCELNNSENCKKAIISYPSNINFVLEPREKYEVVESENYETLVSVTCE